MKTFVIAEAGTGHVSRETSARFIRATRFIEKALLCRADAVKFQLFVPDEPLFCPMPGDDARMERWRDTCLSLDDWMEVQRIARSGGIDILWSVFQPTAVEWLKELKPRYVKVASRAANTFPYDEMDASYLVSDGLNRNRIPEMENFHVLKCVTKYPAPLEGAGYENGYAGLSDHSGTIWPGLDAIAHRARFLEVHFKISGADMGNDEPACLNTDQLKLLCEARDAFAAMH